jgi:hypothetical protein
LHTKYGYKKTAGTFKSSAVPLPLTEEVRLDITLLVDLLKEHTGVIQF